MDWLHVGKVRDCRAPVYYVLDVPCTDVITVSGKHGSGSLPRVNQVVNDNQFWKHLSHFLRIIIPTIERLLILQIE